MEERADTAEQPPDNEGARYHVRRASIPAVDVEPVEMLRGGKPGTRFGRRVRADKRRFVRSGDEGVFTATAHAIAPRTTAGRAWRSVRRVAVGSPISSEHQDEQRLPKTKALAVFSSDALSSSAYATDEILLYLSVAGTAALTHSIAIALAITALLAIVVFSYRQTIRAYPNGGGAYIVARENLGDAAGLSAAAALSVDYVLTVSVSIAAGVLAITSAFPELRGYKIELAVVFIAVITLANLRGVRESGTLFAVPTYGFLIAMAVLLIGGFGRLIFDPGLKAEVPASAQISDSTSALTAFVLLRAFASGCAALTGVEAISNGIPAFKKPESRNAATTLTFMGIILGTLFIGITVLAHRLGVQHSPEISAPAQIAKTVFGENVIFYGIQFFTALILILAANTAYADFPRLGSILARDKFIPHQFTFRGDRLAYSNGIIVLGIAATALIIVFDASVNLLIPLYAFGVFVSFTLSQGGMIVHWLKLRETGWKSSIVINAVGATATAVVAAIIGITKFADGAWLSMTTMAALAISFWLIHAHYTHVDRLLATPKGVLAAWRAPKQTLLVPVEALDQAVLSAVEYARALSDNVTALHVTEDVSRGQQLRRDWERTVLDVPLVLINSPYRSLVAPIVSYIDALGRAGHEVTVVLPEYRARWPWQGWLHNQSAHRLKQELLERPHTVVAQVPYQIR